MNKNSKVTFRQQSKGVVAEVHIEYDGPADEVPSLESQSSEAYKLYKMAAHLIEGDNNKRQLNAVRSKLK